ncbi:MAG: hypothetical protein AB8B51_17805 [Sedimentitalea sp.]
MSHLFWLSEERLRSYFPKATVRDLCTVRHDGGEQRHEKGAV